MSRPRSVEPQTIHCNDATQSFLFELVSHRAASQEKKQTSASKKAVARPRSATSTGRSGSPSKKAVARPRSATSTGRTESLKKSSGNVGVTSGEKAWKKRTQTSLGKSQRIRDQTVMRRLDHLHTQQEIERKQQVGRERSVQYQVKKGWEEERTLLKVVEQFDRVEETVAPLQDCITSVETELKHTERALEVVVDRKQIRKGKPDDESFRDKLHVALNVEETRLRSVIERLMGQQKEGQKSLAEFLELKNSMQSIIQEVRYASSWSSNRRFATTANSDDEGAPQDNLKASAEEILRQASLQKSAAGDLSRDVQLLVKDLKPKRKAAEQKAVSLIQDRIRQTSQLCSAITLERGRLVDSIHIVSEDIKRYQRRKGTSLSQETAAKLIAELTERLETLASMKAELVADLERKTDASRIDGQLLLVGVSGSQAARSRYSSPESLDSTPKTPRTRREKSRQRKDVLPTSNASADRKQAAITSDRSTVSPSSTKLASNQSADSGWTSTAFDWPS